MKIHILQHAAFEGPAGIADWARARGHSLDATRFFEEGFTLPEVSSIDMLVIMGGPMGVHDDAQYPWLAAEKSFIRSCISTGKHVLGVCLGAQLLADALGAKVFPNKVKEIGWFPIAACDEAAGHPLLAGMNHAMTVFHWHGDTFDLPAGATRLMSSKACSNQAFATGNLLALQFHLEMHEVAVEALLQACAHELAPSPTVQDASAIRAGTRHVPACKSALYGLLDRFIAIDSPL